VAAARAAFFPRVALTASAGTASSGLAKLFKTGAWTFAPSITLPIFDGGRTQAGFDMAKAREAAVVAQYERTVQQAFREVADQLSARASVRAQREAADETLVSQRVRHQVQQQRHAAGLIGLLEVLDAERDLLAAEQAQVLMVRAELDAAVGLYRVLGGGAPAPVDSRAQARAPAGAVRPADTVAVTGVEPHGHR
jgi:multidrug efflux system outer membrane protein